MIVIMKDGYERYIFDIDDTLLKLENRGEEIAFLYNRFGEEASRIFGQKKQLLLLLKNYMKIHKNRQIENIVIYLRSNDFEIPDNFFEQWFYFRGHYSKNTILPGTVELLNLLKENNKKLSICTSAISMAQLPRLERTGLKAYFDTIVCGDDISKPHKEAYIASANHIPIDSCIMIGDNAVEDFEGPLNCGMDACLISSENRSEIIRKLSAPYLKNR